MLAFLREWGRALVAGDSLASTLGKVGTIGVFAIGATVLESPMQIAVWLPALSAGWEKEWPVGWTLFGISAVVYVAWMGGVAWVESRGPNLDVATDLIPDGEHQIFRLRVRNSGQGLLSPNAAIVWIEDEGGPSNNVLPVNLTWSNFPSGVRPQLSWNESATTGIAYVRDRGTMAWRLEFAGEFHMPRQSLFNNDVRFCVCVRIPGTKKFQERAFALAVDNGSVFGLKVRRLPYREASYRRAFRWPRARQTADDL